MNCAEFEKLVHELAREDGRETLGEATAVMARFHAETCEACGARFAEAQALALALKDLGEDSAQMEASPQLEGRLIGAFREHRRGLERARYRTRRLRLRWAEWMALAAAAVVLVAVGSWNVPRGDLNVKPSVVRTVNPETNRSVDAAGLAETAEDFGDFVPVPYGESVSPDDSGLVVRVSMTRGALGSLGYPVDEVQAGEVVQADVLVGEDGLPRAVRLVQ